MHRASINHRAVAENGSMVLLARIVDRAGVAVRPADVDRIEYSIYEVDPCWPDLRTVVAGCHVVALDIGEIMSDSLEVAHPWTVDCIGYNFRHEIRPARARTFPKPGADYELKYRFTSSCGQTITVRFQIRCSRIDAGCRRLAVVS